MPIKPFVVQRRHAELGRIRLGDKNKDRGFPQKLDKFRFTSASKSFIEDLATLYGGTAQPWDNSGKPEWEVYTTATSIPVIVVKNGLSQWMETWSGGGCVHRCDGETQVDGTPCDPDDPNHKNAKPTTRLSTMLPELEAIGVWRMESHGWNAAAEIPAVAELAQFVGELVPAHLHLVERRSVKDGKTSRFVVPVLDLHIGAERLREIVAAKVEGRELAPVSSEARAIEAPRTPGEPAAGVTIPSPEAIAAADVETLQKMASYLDAHELSDHPAALAVRDRLAQLQPDADGVVDAELVEPAGDEDAIWEQIVKVGGALQMTLPDLQEDFIAQNGGLIPADANAAQLGSYLRLLRGAEQVPA